SLREGVATAQGGLIQVVLPFDELAGMLPGVNDNRILGCANMLKREGKNVFFISKDINARVKSDALGIPSADFENQKVNVDELYTGWIAFEAPAQRVKELSAVDSIKPSEIAAGLEGELITNQFVLVREEQDEDQNVLFIYDAEEQMLRRLD